MPLPILTRPTSISDGDLLRFYDHTQRLWSDHLAEAIQLDVGTVYVNAELSDVQDANRILDAALPEGVTAATAVKAVDDHYACRGSRCLAWLMNPSAPPLQTEPLIQHLTELGFVRRSEIVMYLKQAVARPNRALAGLRIIPARASFRHVRLLAEEAAASSGTSSSADVALLHLDDPHWDCFLALDGITPVGMAGVLIAGNIGRIDEVFVTESHRRRGIGQVLIARVLETCARSLLKHVLLGVSEENRAATSLYQKFGFVRVGVESTYYPPRVT